MTDNSSYRDRNVSWRCLMAAGLVVTPGVKITRAPGCKHEGSDLQQVYISWILVPTKTPVLPRAARCSSTFMSECVCVCA